MILAAVLLAGSVCLATGMIAASAYIPSQDWTDTTSAAAGGAYVLAILGSFVACSFALATTIATSRRAAIPGLLLLASAVLLTFLSTFLLIGYLIEVGQLPPIFPSRPSA
jgi:hypothetical protein